MDISIECLPCILNQVIVASKMSTDQINIQKKIVMEVLMLLSRYENYKYPPELFREAQSIVMAYTGNSDPYRKIKDQHIKMALDIYPKLNEFLNNKNEKLYWALKIASTGNVIDLAMYSDIDIASIINQEMNIEFAINDFERLKEKLESAKSLLLIGDNAGETVFDRVLIENLSHLDIIYAVRGKAIINDATEEDAFASNMSDCIKIISSGSMVPGTIIKECSDEFLLTFNNADIVISKGQGNYETLSEEKREIFFLLKAKCSAIAQDLSINIGDYVLKSNNKK